MATFQFYKYHGTGNDFILFDDKTDVHGWLNEKTVRSLCRRRFGIGADGVLVVGRTDGGSYWMRIFNADGSEAEMCGNGIRCVAKHIREVLGERDEKVAIQTLAGIKVCAFEGDSISVSMGAPILERRLIPMAGEGGTTDISISAFGREFVGDAVSMGNPHFVVFEWLEEEEARVFGKTISSAPLFPNQTNVEFVKVLSPAHIRMRVYERGCGLTMACGTGASAAVVAGTRRGILQGDKGVRVDLPGGTLQITVARDLSDVILSGPARRVFAGIIESSDFEQYEMMLGNAEPFSSQK